MSLNFSLFIAEWKHKGGYIMEKKTIGSFLAALRKANGMTQQEVADRLNVSNKTVSKWERDEGCPEIMMLPLIAELYSVTVDDILRGERITKEENVEIKETKSEKQIKYLIDRATTKFKNLSIISIVLGVASVLLAYTLGDIINYDFLWVGLLITLLLASASVIVIAIAVNNLLSGFNDEEIIDNDDIQSTKKTCIKYISTITFLTILVLCGIILNIIFSGVSFAFVSLPAFLVVAGLPTYLIRSKLNKKWKIEEIEKLSPEQKKYRKKHIKITSIIVAVCVVLSFVLPFVSATIEQLVPNRETYCFLDGVHEDYENIGEAQKEYNRLKSFVIDDKKLYEVISNDYENYVLVVEEMKVDFEKTKNGYKAITHNFDTTEYETMYFDSAQEMEKFEKENCWYNNIIILPELLQENISFDDNTYTVEFSYKNQFHLSSFFDILPVFLIGGSCVCIAVFGGSVGIYLKNKKKIQ